MDTSFWNTPLSYQSPKTPFVDAFSRFGIGFNPRRMGPAFLYPRGTQPSHDENPFIQPLLNLWVKDAGLSFAVQPTRFESLPWAALEEGIIPATGGPIKVTACHVYEDAGTLLSEYAFRSESKEIEPVIFWSGCLQDDIPQKEAFKFYAGTRALPRESFMEQPGARAFWLGWRNGNPSTDLPQAGCLIEADHELDIVRSSSAFAKGVALTGEPENRFFQVSPKECLSVGKDRPLIIRFRLRFLQEPASQSMEPPSLGREIASASEFQEYARKRFMDELNSETLPDANISPFSMNKLMESRFHLLRNGICGGHGRWAGKKAILCSASRNFSVVFFWDSIFSSVALSSFNKEFSRDALEVAFNEMDKRDGATPESKFNYGTPARTLIHSPQSPVGAWALQHYLDLHKDEDFAAPMYETLVRNHEFWTNYCDADRDGLCEYRWSGQAADNSPLWDDLAVDLEAGFNWIPPVASVPLNSFLYRDALHLAEIARSLGRSQDVLKWESRASGIAERLLRYCHHPEDKCFWDYNQLTQRHTKVKTFYMFWPLYAGIPMPEKTRRHLIENVLLDPRQFFGDIPFPSVAYDEPAYDPKGYWRGRSWPHISYWLLETLTKYGYAEEAHEAARRIISRETETDGFTENLVTSPEVYGEDGFAGYNWGAAASHMIHARCYEKLLHPRKN